MRVFDLVIGGDIVFFPVHAEFFPATDFDDPVFHAAPLGKTFALATDEEDLLACEAAGVAVPGALVVFAAVIDPDVFGDLTGREFVAAKDVGDDFAQRGVGSADVAVRAAGRAGEEFADGFRGGEEGGSGDWGCGGGR